MSALPVPPLASNADMLNLPSIDGPIPNSAQISKSAAAAAMLPRSIYFARPLMLITQIKITPIIVRSPPREPDRYTMSRMLIMKTELSMILFFFFTSVRHRANAMERPVAKSLGSIRLVISIYILPPWKKLKNSVLNQAVIMLQKKAYLISFISTSE